MSSLTKRRHANFKLCNRTSLRKRKSLRNCFSLFIQGQIECLSQKRDTKSRDIVPINILTEGKYSTYSMYCMYCIVKEEYLEWMPVCIGPRPNCSKWCESYVPWDHGMPYHTKPASCQTKHQLSPDNKIERWKLVSNTGGCYQAKAGLYWYPQPNLTC